MAHILVFLSDSTMAKTISDKVHNFAEDHTISIIDKESELIEKTNCNTNSYILITEISESKISENHFTKEFIKKEIPLIIISENEAVRSFLGNYELVNFLWTNYCDLELSNKILGLQKLKKFQERTNNAKAELAQKQEEFTQFVKEQNEMMSIAAHDLRSPLNKILGFAQLLPLIGNLNEEQQQYIKQINHIVEDGRRLIDDILILNPAEKYEYKLKLDTLELKEFISGVLKAHKQSADEKQIELDFTCNKQQVLVNTDKDCILRILDNLISNAIKFSYQESKISVSLKEFEEEIEIAVIDEGQGMNESDQKKLFKKFQQFEAKPTAGEGSTGLGLAIVKTLVEKLHGTISYQSKLHEGTTFWVRFPQ